MIKDDTYCSNCHWQLCRHFKSMQRNGLECPNPEGLYEPGIGYFTWVPIHGETSNEVASLPEAVEAADTVEEPFDAYRAWRIQKVGILCIIMLGIVCSMLIGIYLGHFVWLTP